MIITITLKINVFYPTLLVNKQGYLQESFYENTHIIYIKLLEIYTVCGIISMYADDYWHCCIWVEKSIHGHPCLLTSHCTYVQIVHIYLSQR